MPEGKKKGKQQGVWFQIKCVVDVIKSKESRGENATFERDLLKSWSGYEGYEGAKQALTNLGKPVTKREGRL